MPNEMNVRDLPVGWLVNKGAWRAKAESSKKASEVTELRQITKWKTLYVGL
jgi:hypothetical protein